MAGVIEIADLDAFVRVMSAWHTEKVAVVRHLLTMPEGAEFQVGEGEVVTTTVLTGDTLAAFKLGVEMALMQLGTLPFVVELEDATPPAPDAAG